MAVATNVIIMFCLLPVRFLDMHMYVTSALQRTDMKAVGLQLALDLLHEKVSDEQCSVSPSLDIVSQCPLFGGSHK